MKKFAKELVKIAKSLVARDVVIASNSSDWAWEDDENIREAELILDDSNGTYRLKITETHTKLGIGAGRSVKVLEDEFVGDTKRINLGKIRTLLAQHGHERTRAGSPFKRLWKDISGNEKPLKDILANYSKFQAPNAPVQTKPVETDEYKRDLLIDKISTLRGRELDEALERLGV